MSAAEIITIIAAVGGLVTILGGVIVNIVSAMRQESKAALDKIEAKTEVIAGRVDGAATASVAKIEGLQKEMALLRETVADQKQVAAVLAAQSTGSQAAPVAPSSAVVESLGNIESHTEKTAAGVEKLAEKKK